MRCIFTVVFIFFNLSVFAQQQEEFNGPFPSWANVKLRFGAKGNGKDDDTKAIQQAIDGLGPSANNNSQGPLYTVLYLPAGTYCISSTLVLRGKIGVSIIGEDPSTTIIKWTGPDADTMLWANGSAYYKISRLTWNANNRKEMEAIGIHWKNKWNDGKTQSYASLNIEISDNIFTGNCKYGISGGTSSEGTNSNDSEIAIKRCTFQGCTAAGIITSGYNALDYWIWDCRFYNCSIGINNRYGNFHAYRCYFKNSSQADVTNTMGYYKSLRGCYSEDSKSLEVDSGASDNAFKRIYQANTVLRTKWIPIQFYHWGKMVFMDNIFDKSTDTSISNFANSSSTIFSLNNTYHNKGPVKLSGPYAQFKQYSDTYMAAKPASTAIAFLQQQQKTPLYIKRQVFEIPVNADANAIQQVINSAVNSKGKKAIVHFAPGTHKINKPLLIPANTEIQITGDGFIESSILLPATDFPPGNAMIKITGPSNVVIRDLQFGTFTNSRTGIDAIDFVNADQPDSRAFIDQIYAFGNNAIRCEGLDYLYVQKDNSFFADNDFISGGPLTQAGKGSAGIFGFGGQFAGISVQNNARAVLKDCWWEGVKRVPLNFSGSGSITIDGAMIAPDHADSTTTVSIKKFTGKITLCNMYLAGGIDAVADNPGLELLLMNINFYHALNPLTFTGSKSSFHGLFTGLTALCFIPNDKRCQQTTIIPDRANLVPDADTFLPQMLVADRSALPQKYEVKNSAGSNLLISRTSMGDMNNAIKFTK